MNTYPKRIVIRPETERRPEKTATVVLCCKVELICIGFTTTCDRCGADFNWNGRRLAPRSQWGEETGESFS